MSAGDDRMHRSRRDGRNGRAFQSAQSFSKIKASGMSRVHIGNNTYSITCNLFRDSDHATLLPTDRTLGGILPSPIERLSMGEHQRPNRAMRQDRRQQSMKVALVSLEKHATCARKKKTGEDHANIGAQLAVILDTIARSKHGNGPLQELDDRIHSLREQISKSRCIEINEPPPRQGVAQFSRAESKILSIYYGHWEISLTTKTVKSGCVDGQSELSAIETCSALHVRSFRGSKGACIAAFFRDTSSIDQYQSLPPILFTYRQVSNTDRIFKLVANDDLRGLHEVLRAREAFLRDCDENGRSLLFYASLHASVQVCKFLVDSGAEVDRFHYDYYRTSHQTTALLAFRHTDQTTREYLDRAQICRKALLQAGADPTISHAGSDIRSALLESIQGNVDCSGSNEFFELLITEGSTFIDTRKLQNAWSPVTPPDL